MQEGACRGGRRFHEGRGNSPRQAGQQGNQGRLAHGGRGRGRHLRLSRRRNRSHRRSQLRDGFRLQDRGFPEICRFSCGTGSETQSCGPRRLERPASGRRHGGRDAQGALRAHQGEHIYSQICSDRSQGPPVSVYSRRSEDRRPGGYFRRQGTARPRSGHAHRGVQTARPVARRRPRRAREKGTRHRRRESGRVGQTGKYCREDGRRQRAKVCEGSNAARSNLRQGSCWKADRGSSPQGWWRVGFALCAVCGRRGNRKEGERSGGLKMELYGDKKKERQPGMTATAKYKRILLKLSGEALMGDDSFGINRATIERIVGEIAQVAALGLEIAVVIGGGNIFRGVAPGAAGMDRATADYIGMLATIMNALALQDAMRQAGLNARVQSALNIEQVVEPYIRNKAIRYLEEGKIVIFAAGTGNPFFTTDTAAALRGTEIGAEMVLKATKVDGVYTADPKLHPDAKRYDKLSFDEAMIKNLRVMDATAFALCRDQKLPITVFSILKAGAMKRVVTGENEGTLVYVSA